jgi:DNA/RNA endonuclease YhcR with UshA esterase domain
MRLPAILIVFLFAAAPIVSDDISGKPISLAEAAKNVGDRVTVEMEVKSMGGKGPYFLNSEVDFKDTKNFTLFIPKDAVEKFEKAKIDELPGHYKGKTLRVTGTVSLYREKPQIEVEDPEQIKIVENK